MEELKGAKLLVRVKKKAAKPGAGATLRSCDHRRRGVTFEFHLVDLKKKEIEFNCLPLVTTADGIDIGSLSMIDSFVYLLRGARHCDHNFNDNDNDNDNQSHTGLSRINLASPGSKYWEFLENPNFPDQECWPNSCTLMGKLYCFGAPVLCPRVLHPKQGHSWVDVVLPPQYSGCSVAYPVVSDPLNNRFLLYFDELREIHAFYPLTGVWDRVVSSFNREWHPAVAVADNILFFHDYYMPHFVTAFDLTTLTWLNVSAEYTYLGAGRAIAFASTFHAIFSLPAANNVICLASALLRVFNTPASVHFLTFTFKRTSDNDLLITAIDYQSHDLPSLDMPHDFLLL